MTIATHYRPDIDGLRAVAVVAVLLFHGHLGLDSGFMGVDVFFVLSGYLITGILLREQAAGRLSLRAFYLRRVRRILPALFVVMVSVLLAMTWIGLPFQQVNSAWTALAALGFVANRHLAAQESYFAPIQEFDPLLHLWSLSVEEQVYLMLPIVVVVGARLGRPRAALVTVVAGSSLAAWVGGHEPGAFYATSYRLWEIALGGLVATLPTQRNPTVAWAGAALLFIGALGIDPSVMWPGPRTLFPVVGTALLLWGDGTSRVARALSTTPLVAIGRLSYSLYLWHWPCLTLTRLLTASSELSTPTTLAALAGSFLLAAISTRWVERPWRSDRFDNPQAVVGAVAGALTVAAVAYTVVHSEGRLFPPGPLQAERLQARHDTSPHFVTCLQADAPDAAGCAFGPDNAPPTVLLWGDSHAPALLPAVDEALGLTGRLSWHNSCAPLVGVDIANHPDQQGCRQSRRETLRWLQDHPNIDTVILSVRWLPATGTLSESGGSLTIRIQDEVTTRLSETENLRVLQRGLQRTLDAIERPGRRVVVVGGLPEFGIDAPTIAALSARHGQPIASTLSHTTVRAAYAPIHDIMTGVDRPDMTWIALHESLCDDVCRLLDEGQPLYFDHNHLTVHAARTRVAPALSAHMPRR